ncbi:MAG: ATP-binding region, ATPase domain protein [Nocardioides sp.]|nr:ATP-binding region, ATPase domain protein [Nocardioides sp.]
MRTPRTWTLRARATCAAAVVYAAALGGAAFLLVGTLESSLTGASDDLSVARIGDLADAATSQRLPAVVHVDEESVAQVVDAEGRVLAASPNVAGRARISTLEPGDALVVRTEQAPDDDETETYRLWAGTVETPDGVVTVYVGRSEESVSETTRTLRRALLLLVPLTVLLITWVTWWVIGRVLARLDRIRREVDQITATELDRRVGDDGASDEVGRLAATMNAMLARLQDAAVRERSFVADVSHDLQSPLTTQRILLELAIGDGDGALDAAACREVLGATTEMEGLVADLLVLSRLDADGAHAVERAHGGDPVDLDDIVLEEAMRVRQREGVDVDTSGVSAAPVRGDPSDLRRVVRNVVENAVRHAATRVEVGLRAGAGVVVLEVVDDGDGVPEPDRERIFDRFYRGDRSRTRGTGSGLGLPIARSLARRLGGDVTVVDAAEPGARFRVTLPRA